MSKMSELSQVVDEIRRCGEALIGISESIAVLFSSKENAVTSDQPQDDSPIETEKVVTLEEVRAVLANKSRAGYTAEVRTLLIKYGAEKLSEISPADYSALLIESEDLGNG